MELITKTIRTRKWNWIRHTVGTMTSRKEHSLDWNPIGRKKISKHVETHFKQGVNADSDYLKPSKTDGIKVEFF